MPAPRSVILQPMAVAVSVFFAAPDTGQMLYSVVICNLTHARKATKKESWSQTCSACYSSCFQTLLLKIWFIQFSLWVSAIADTRIVPDTHTYVNKLFQWLLKLHIMSNHIFKIISNFPLIIFKTLKIITLYTIKNVIYVFNLRRWILMKILRIQADGLPLFK